MEQQALDLAENELINDIQRMMSRLRGGGPEVNWELVVQYIDKQLQDEAGKRVQALILTYRDWYSAWVETIGALTGTDEELTRARCS